MFFSDDTRIGAPLVEWYFPDPPSPWFAELERRFGPIRSVADWRRAGRMLLDERSGGPLGVDGVSEVVVGATDLDRKLEAWQALLDPVACAEPGLWHLGAGPSLRVVPHHSDCVLTLRVRVRSLALAEQVLREQELLGSSADGELLLDPAATLGLDLRLVA